MIDPQVARAVLAIYSVLLMAGGVMGFVKAKSRPSLIAGVASGLVGIGAVILAGSSRYGLILGVALAAGMMVTFGGRYMASRKFMPSGMLAILSVLVWAVMSFSLFPGR